MESGQSLKRRMKSVQNIGQITKAMELVSATKMRKSQELALTSRPYAYAALELLGILSSLKDVPTPAILQKRTVEKRAFLLMMSDRGLAGSFNGAVIREFEQYMKANNIDISDPRLFVHRRRPEGERAIWNGAKRTSSRRSIASATSAASWRRNRSLIF